MDSYSDTSSEGDYDFISNPSDEDSGQESVSFSDLSQDDEEFDYMEESLVSYDSGRSANSTETPPNEPETKQEQSEDDDEDVVDEEQKLELEKSNDILNSPDLSTISLCNSNSTLKMPMVDSSIIIGSGGGGGDGSARSSSAVSADLTRASGNLVFCTNQPATPDNVLFVGVGSQKHKALSMARHVGQGSNARGYYYGWFDAAGALIVQEYTFDPIMGWQQAAATQKPTDLTNLASDDEQKVAVIGYYCSDEDCESAKLLKTVDATLFAVSKEGFTGQVVATNGTPMKRVMGLAMSLTEQEFLQIDPLLLQKSVCECCRDFVVTSSSLTALLMPFLTMLVVAGGLGLTMLFQYTMFSASQEIIPVINHAATSVIALPPATAPSVVDNKKPRKSLAEMPFFPLAAHKPDKNASVNDIVEFAQQQAVDKRDEAWTMIDQVINEVFEILSGVLQYVAKLGDEKFQEFMSSRWVKYAKFAACEQQSVRPAHCKWLRDQGENVERLTVAGVAQAKLAYHHAEQYLAHIVQPAAVEVLSQVQSSSKDFMVSAHRQEKVAAKYLQEMQQLVGKTSEQAATKYYQQMRKSMGDARNVMDHNLHKAQNHARELWKQANNNNRHRNNNKDSGKQQQQWRIKKLHLNPRESYYSMRLRMKDSVERKMNLRNRHAPPLHRQNN